MSEDPTEDVRRALQSTINVNADELRASLEEQHQQVWDTKELAKDFEVLSFLAPFVAVRRKSDGQLGSLMFAHQPRFYFGWKPDSI